MKVNVLVLLGAVGLTAAQGVTTQISPPDDAPAGCTGSASGNFELTVVNVVNAKRELAIAPRADCGGPGVLVLSLANGVLTDSDSRTGYVASNFQFQFDNPPQAGAIYTAGFSVCGNGSLALGGSAVFYQCSSGSFSNLYDRNWAAQCSPVELATIPCGAGSGNAGQNGDGQVIATSIVQTTIISALGDGQPQVITTAVPIPICQITDGQAQVHTTPCASVTGSAMTTAAPVSQYSDGQIQVTPGGAGGAPPASTPAGAAPTTTAPASGGSGGSGSGGSGSGGSGSGGSGSGGSGSGGSGSGGSGSGGSGSGGSGSGGSGSGGSGSGGAGSGGSGGAGSGSGGSNTTLSTSASPPVSSGSSAPASTSSKPASGGAGRVEIASLSAIVVGLVGTVLFL